MLKSPAKSGRNAFGDAGFDPAFGVDQRVGAKPLIVVVVGRIVRVCRQASTNLRARSSFDRASGASSRSRSPSSRAAWSEKDRNPYNRRSSAPQAALPMAAFWGTGPVGEPLKLGFAPRFLQTLPRDDALALR